MTDISIDPNELAEAMRDEIKTWQQGLCWATAPGLQAKAIAAMSGRRSAKPQIIVSGCFFHDEMLAVGTWMEGFKAAILMSAPISCEDEDVITKDESKYDTHVFVEPWMILVSTALDDEDAEQINKCLDKETRPPIVLRAESISDFLRTEWRLFSNIEEST